MGLTKAKMFSYQTYSGILVVRKQKHSPDGGSACEIAVILQVPGKTRMLF